MACDLRLCVLAWWQGVSLVRVQLGVRPRIRGGGAMARVLRIWVCSSVMVVVCR